MMKLSRYQSNRYEKLDAIVTSVNIERNQKVFVESNNLNLSAIVRDAILSLMSPEKSKIEKQAQKVVEAWLKGSANVDRELENLQKTIDSEE